jgi:P27 family predicted phage terminase small subunit
MPTPIGGGDGEGQPVPRRRATDLLPPEPPWELDACAQDMWDRLAPDLIARGVFESLDCALLANFCEAVSTARAARAIIIRSGVLMTGRRDGLVTSPAWRVYRESTDRMRLLAHEFGLSPASRTLLQRLEASGQLPAAEHEEAAP